MKLIEKKCKPCEGGVIKLSGKGIKTLNSSLQTPWLVNDQMKISKQFNFTNYHETIKFVNQVAMIAEEEGHHPVMLVSYSKVDIYLWTHAILGLSENDFILAAKIDAIAK
jgi:4a-hydroxytetrahydrobiopterin dehydratase